MACIGNSTDTSHFIFWELRLNYLCFFLADFSDLALRYAGHRKKTASSSYCDNPFFLLNKMTAVMKEFIIKTLILSKITIDKRLSLY